MANSTKEIPVTRLEIALKDLGRAPNNSAFGHVVEDCALIHIDYAAAIDHVASALVDAIAEITGEAAPEVAARLRPPHECDCPAGGCAGPERAAEIRAEYQAHLLAKLTPEFRAALSSESQEGGGDLAERLRDEIEEYRRAAWESAPKTGSEGRAAAFFVIIHRLQALLDTQPVEPSEEPEVLKLKALLGKALAFVPSPHSSLPDASSCLQTRILEALSFEAVPCQVSEHVEKAPVNNEAPDRALLKPEGEPVEKARCETR